MGQSLYNSVSFGAGGALGSLASSYLWQYYGPESAFGFAAGIAFLGSLGAWYGLESQHYSNS
jgi:PPP family 3-phenylpropionic acid transporter